MSSPDVRSAPKPAPAESSSLVRWLFLAAILVVLAVGASIVIPMLPTEGRPDEGSLAGGPMKPKGPPGKVVLSEDPAYKFDVMPQRTTGTHTWTFKNEGTGNLELWKGPSTCSCTIANFPDAKSTLTLKPGGSTEITLTWETRDFEGKYEKSATINVLGDPERQRVVFSVEGTIRPAVTVAPPERILAFGTYSADQPAKGKFAIASADKPDMKIVSLTSTRPDEIVLTPVPLPDSDRQELDWTKMKGGYLIKVEIKPSKSLGPFSEEIIVTTDHPLVKEVRLTIGGKREGPISVFPETAYLHNVSPEDGGTAAVMITVRGGTKTKLEVLEAPNNLKVEVAPVDVKTGTDVQVSRYRMTVTVPPDTASGIINGTIVLKSDHPLVNRVKVPVDITVLGGN